MGMCFPNGRVPSNGLPARLIHIGVTQTVDCTGEIGNMQAEHDRVHSELFEVRAHRDAAASVEADDADLAAVEHEQALARVRYSQPTYHGQARPP